MNYGDILYHQPCNESINGKLESIQYNATLAITRAIKGTSRSKLYKELGLESLKSRKTLRRFCAFHKIVSTRLPAYLCNLIRSSTHAYQTRLQVTFQHANVGLIFLNILFFLGLLLSGTNYIQILEMHLSQFLKSTY